MPAIYIHWPFCVSKCPYCDFNSHVGDTTDQEPWRRAYRRELEHYAALYAHSPVTSVFFGGGTPSLMEVRTVASVLEDIARVGTLENNAEITLEANPSSVEAAKFRAFRAAGVNRLSLGVQSLNDDVLRFFGRAHNATEARAALALAADTFPRFSFDLIYGYAGHTVDAWKQELRKALTLASGHVSLYQLTLEPHTHFFVRAARGETLTASDDHAAALYETTQEIMDAAGLPAYEISNHARHEDESRHNLTYWHYEDYIGIGPGAHGRLGIETIAQTEVRSEGDRSLILPASSGVVAIENWRAPERWLRQVETEGQGKKVEERLDLSVAMREALMMGLRLAEGIDLKRWEEKFSCPLLSLLDPARLQRMEKEGLMALSGTTLRATREGLQRLNALLAYVI